MINFSSIYIKLNMLFPINYIKSLFTIKFMGETLKNSFLNLTINFVIEKLN